MKNLKRISRKDLRKLTGGEGSQVCGMTCASGQVISMHHCDSCAPMTGGAGMGCAVESPFGRGLTMYVETCN